MTYTDDSQLEALIVKIREVSGFDFSGYARASLMRRTKVYLDKNDISLPKLLSSITPETGVAYEMIQGLTVNYSEMFRDPDFFNCLKSEVFGYLESYASPRIWVAGCASGEEAFSLSIFLKEAGLLDQSVIYATDISQRVLSLARDGVFSLAGIRNFSENYLLAGGASSLSDYYSVSYNRAVIHHEMRKNIVFSVHDLTGDSVFNEFQMICCRNVMIYFTVEQRKIVLKLLYDSLSIFGFLCLGKREWLRYSGMEENFRIVNQSLNIYQKIQ
jgi:chemotaxis protein methyltransferase CheR